MDNSRGFGLIQILVASVLLALLGLFAGQMTNTLFKVGGHIQWKKELEDIRNLFRTVFDCEQTMADANNRIACRTGGFIRGLRDDGSVLFEAFPNVTRFGQSELGLRASCLRQGKKSRMTIEYIRDRGEDPLFEKDESQWQNLFTNIPRLCDSRIFLDPDYETCAGFVGAGFQGYPVPGRCPQDQVVVIVNDGLSETLSCCPVDPALLSPKPADRYIIRNNICNAGEVMTGMNAVKFDNPVQIFCTKLNSGYGHGATSNSVLTDCSSYPVGSYMHTLISSYGVCDACVCPEGTFVIGAPGGHRWVDNICDEQCVDVVEQ